MTAGGSLELISAVVSFAGSFTGKKYNVNLNGVITTMGAGEAWIYGNQAGTVSTGGQIL